MKLRNYFRMGYFRNKGQIRITPTRWESVLCEYILNDLNYAWTQAGPICLEEESMKVIRARCL